MELDGRKSLPSSMAKPRIRCNHQIGGPKLLHNPDTRYVDQGITRETYRKITWKQSKYANDTPGAEIFFECFFAEERYNIKNRSDSRFLGCTATTVAKGVAKDAPYLNA